VAGGRILTLERLEDPPRRVAVNAWTLDGAHLDGPVTWAGYDNLVVNRPGTALAYTSGRAVLVRTLDGLTPGPERVIGRQEAPVEALSLSASGTAAASSDAAGNVRVWNVDRGGVASREVHAEIPSGIAHALALDAAGTMLVTTAEGAVANVWDLGAPAGVLPQPLRSQRELTWQVRFSPEGRWVAALSRVLTLWPLPDVYPRVLKSASAAMPGSLAFDPLGRWLAVASSEGVRLWPMPGRSGESVQLLRGGSNLCCTVVFTAIGDRLLVGDAGLLDGFAGGNLRLLGLGLAQRALARHFGAL
jgi:WD40 repeat protein